MEAKLYRKTDGTALYRVDGNFLMNMNGSEPPLRVSMPLIDSMLRTKQLEEVPEQELRVRVPTGSYWYDPEGMTYLIVQAADLTLTWSVYGHDQIHFISLNRFLSQPMTRVDVESFDEAYKPYLPSGRYMVLDDRPNDDMLVQLMEPEVIETPLILLGGLTAPRYLARTGDRVIHVNSQWLAMKLILGHTNLLGLQQGQIYEITADNLGKKIERLSHSWNQTRRLGNMNGRWAKGRKFIVSTILPLHVGDEKSEYLAGIQLSWYDDRSDLDILSIKAWMSLVSDQAINLVK